MILTATHEKSKESVRTISCPIFIDGLKKIKTKVSRREVQIKFINILFFQQYCPS